MKGKKRICLLSALLLVIMCIYVFPLEPGDVNCNGSVDIVDALLMARCYVELYPKPVPCSKVIYFENPELEYQDRIALDKHGGVINTLAGMISVKPCLPS